MVRKVSLYILILGVLFIAVIVFFYFQNRQSRTTKISEGVMSETPNVQESQFMPLTTIIAKNLSVPWGMVFLPNGDLLVTERKGTVRLVKKDSGLESVPVGEIPIKQIGESGLHGITIHPKFEENQYVYVYYTHGSLLGNTLNRVERYTYENGTLTNPKVIVDDIPGAQFHDGGRVQFGPDGYLYISTGDAQDPSQSQDKNSLAGKILRVKDDGSNPPDNPFNNAVYSYGHRNPQGIAWDSDGNLWETEHGQSAHDEVNKILPGLNYGWPTIEGDETQRGLVSPILQSGTETWAPGGIAIIGNNAYFGGLRGKALFKVDINQTPPTLTKYFDGEYGRIRNVVVGPDGMLYIATSNRDGRGAPTSEDDMIIRVNPNKL